MNDRIATREDALSIATTLRDRLPVLIGKREKTASECKEYTGSIWEFFAEYASSQLPPWKIYPKTEPTHGRGKGEYLVDFSLFDDERGCRIACESDWGSKQDVEWAFDKLRGLKADVKILLFEAPHAADEKLARRELFEKYLYKSHHHAPGREFYVFMQFDREKCRIFLWEPNENGPLMPDTINFDLLHEFSN